MITRRVDYNMGLKYGVEQVSDYRKLCLLERSDGWARPKWHTGRTSLLNLSNNTLYIDGELTIAEGLNVRYTFFR